MRRLVDGHAVDRGDLHREIELIVLAHRQVDERGAEVHVVPDAWLDRGAREGVQAGAADERPGDKEDDGERQRGGDAPPASWTRPNARSRDHAKRRPRGTPWP